MQDDDKLINEKSLSGKELLLAKLRSYTSIPDDEPIRYKEIIKDTLLRCPELLYSLHEESLESELFDEDGNINEDGEWDRYFGEGANIRPYLFIPETHTDTKHYLCYQVSFSTLGESNIQKYTLITFTVIIDGSDSVDSLTGIPRHDLISSIIQSRFNWSNIFGMQAKLISNKESTTDNDFITRTLVFEILDTNGINYTPYNDDTYIRNNGYWK
jgi:hypothetical protein